MVELILTVFVGLKMKIKYFVRYDLFESKSPALSIP